MSPVTWLFMKAANMPMGLKTDFHFGKNNQPTNPPTPLAAGWEFFPRS